jgi:hypothetical protein
VFLDAWRGGIIEPDAFDDPGGKLWAWAGDHADDLSVIGSDIEARDDDADDA